MTANTIMQLPSSYLILDTETSGFARSDLIVQAGWGVVVNNELRLSEDLLLDWTRLPEINQSWLRERLAAVRDSMAADGRHYRITYEMLAADGVDPYECLEMVQTLLQDHLDSGKHVVGHGIWHFDRDRLNCCLANYGLKQVVWHPGLTVDTGLIEKSIEADMPQAPQESLEAWQDRVNRAKRKGLKWNLAYCDDKYAISRRYGIDAHNNHTAAADCRMIWGLMETFREIFTRPG